MLQRIVVPLDGSQLAEGILPWVKTLVSCTGAEIHLLRVAVSPYYDYLVADPMMAVGLREGINDEARSYVERVSAELAAEGIHTVCAVVSVAESVADCIIEYARTSNADLVAMSTHGRTGPARWFLGSVADRVVRGAHCPVLMYRPVKEGESSAPR
jgi:nucleotide-binding universal stress UspA family protein